MPTGRAPGNNNAGTKPGERQNQQTTPRSASSSSSSAGLPRTHAAATPPATVRRYHSTYHNRRAPGAVAAAAPTALRPRIHIKKLLTCADRRPRASCTTPAPIRTKHKPNMTLTTARAPWPHAHTRAWEICGLIPIRTAASPPLRLPSGSCIGLPPRGAMLYKVVTPGVGLVLNHFGWGQVICAAASAAWHYSLQTLQNRCDTTSHRTLS